MRLENAIETIQTERDGKVSILEKRMAVLEARMHSVSTMHELERAADGLISQMERAAERLPVNKTAGFDRVERVLLGIKQGELCRSCLLQRMDDDAICCKKRRADE